MELPVTIVAIGAGFAYGTAGYSHHLIEDFGALSAFDLDIYSPTMPNNVEKCLEAIFAQRRPAYLRLGKGGERNFDISENVYDFPGKLSEIPRSDWTILVNSAILEEVVEAVKRMRREGSNAVILSCWKSNNFSGDEIEFLKNCKRLVVVEEHVIRGGFGSYICEILDMAPNRIAKRGISKVDKHLIGSTRYMRENYGLNSEQLFNFFMNL
jgi:transketolase